MKNNFIGKQGKETEDKYPRTFKVCLSNKALEALFIKAGSVGLTPERLLEEFIVSLTSDQMEDCDVEKANDWYNSCWFSEDKEYFSFLQYAIDKGIYNNIISLINKIEEYSSILGFIRNSAISDSFMQVKKITYSDVCKSLEMCHKTLTDKFLEYCKENTAHGSYESEVRQIKEYDVNLNLMLYEKTEKDGNNDG